MLNFVKNDFILLKRDYFDPLIVYLFLLFDSLVSKIVIIFYSL